MITPIIQFYFRTVPDQYSKKLVSERLLTESDVEQIKNQHYAWLNEHLKAVDSYQPEVLT